jgi:hypothetical protein
MKIIESKADWYHQNVLLKSLLISVCFDNLKLFGQFLCPTLW